MHKILSIIFLCIMSGCPFAFGDAPSSSPSGWTVSGTYTYHNKGGVGAELMNKGYELVIPAPTLGGSTTKNEAYSMTQWNNVLYTGYYSGTSGTPTANIYSWDGKTFSLFKTLGTGSHFNGVSSLASYNGCLYAGNNGASIGDGDVYVTCDGSTWTKSYDNAADDFAWSLGTFKGKLYMGQGFHTAAIISFDGTNWTTVYSGLSGTNIIDDFIVYKGILFASAQGPTNGAILSSPDGTNWSVEYQSSSSAAGFTRFAEFRGHLYADKIGTSEVWVRNDSANTWSKVITLTGTQCWGLNSYNNSLYVGCTQTSGGALIYKSFDGVNYTIDLTNNSQGGQGNEVFTMYNYNGSLYIGMGFASSSSGDIWRKTDSYGQILDWHNNFLNSFSLNTQNGNNWGDLSMIQINKPVNFLSNVGIGTSSIPSQALDINGTVRAGSFTGQAGAGLFGAWSTFSDNTPTLATSDGIAIVSNVTLAASTQCILYTDSSNPPTTPRCVYSVGLNVTTGISCMEPVRKGDYYKSLCSGGSPGYYFLPLGS